MDNRGNSRANASFADDLTESRYCKRAIREMGDAARNPAPRNPAPWNQLLVWIVSTIIV